MKKNKNKKNHTKALIIAILALILVVAGICTGFYIRKKIRDRTVNIAFYGLSDEYISLLKEYIPQEENVILNFDLIAPNAMDLSVLTKKYDMLFTWKGEVTDSLAGVAENIPERILENIPNSLRDKKCMPLLLDHFEIDVNKELVSKIKINPSENLSDFENFLEEAARYVFSPFFTNGGDNRTLLAFLAALTESYGGKPAYDKLIESMKNSESLSDFIDVELAALPGRGEKLTVHYILDLLKTWPQKGLVHPQWYHGNFNDMISFSESSQLAAFFTNLESHRGIKYSVISSFETMRMPYFSENTSHGLIAPAISCVLISDNANSKKILSVLTSMDVQGALSMKTKLAPVHYRAESYDVQADDVRFWAASCAGGALPDPYLAVYQRKPELFEEITKEIRSYLR